jgi:hypothetical protein
MGSVFSTFADTNDIFAASKDQAEKQIDDFADNLTTEPQTSIVDATLHDDTIDIGIKENNLHPLEVALAKAMAMRAPTAMTMRIYGDMGDNKANTFHNRKTAMSYVNTAKILMSGQTEFIQSVMNIVNHKELLSRDINWAGVEKVEALYAAQHVKNMMILTGGKIHIPFDYMTNTHNDIQHQVAYTLRQYENTHTVSAEGLEMNTDENKTIRTRKHKTKKNRKP